MTARRRVWKGPDALRDLLEQVPALTPDPDNARRHGPRDLKVLAGSLDRHGQQKPIVARREHRGMTNVVLAGNGTLAAATDLGWTHLAVVWFEGSDEEAEAYRLVDNRSAELSEWDFQVLSGQLKDLQATHGLDYLAALGWSDAEAGPLLQADWRLHGALPDDPGDRHAGVHHVVVTTEQYEVVGLAINHVRRLHDDPEMSEGRCLELICADYNAGK